MALLLGSGADQVALDRQHRSPLMRAAVANQQRTVLPLLGSAVNLQARDSATGRCARKHYNSTSLTHTSICSSTSQKLHPRDYIMRRGFSC